MAATLHQCNTATTQSPLKSATNNSPNPQLKRLVYSKYRELLGSYNDQANAYIDTLPSYMVHKDNGFNIELKNETPTNAHAAANAANTIILTTPPPGGNEMYGSGQRMPGQSTYEAPACVQNAMTRDKKPFTYTPGGIDLSQIKSERMAKRLARNACIEGAAGQSQQNRPNQPMTPCSPGSAAASMGAAAMGMPFQVLPPSPHPTAGKNLNGGSAPAPPPPPPSSSQFLNTGKPQMNGVNGGRGSAPTSPNMPRKTPAGPPQRFEPPPLGFRPEIKIPPNPMAALRKVPPPVEKNTFWKDEYKKNKGVDETPVPTNNYNTNNYNNGMNYSADDNDSVNSSSSSTPQTNASNGTEYTKTNGETNYNNSDTIDGFKRTMPTTNTNRIQPQQTTNTTNIQEQQEAIKTPLKPSTPPAAAEAEKPKSQSQSPREASQDTQSITSITSSSRPTPPTSPFTQQQQQQQQQSANRASKPVERETSTPPAPVASPPKPVSPPSQITQIQAASQQKQQSPKPEFRSVAAAAPTQPAVNNVFNRQTDSPRSVENATPPRVSESPFKYAQQQQQQQQRAPVTMSPLAQQTTPSSGSSGASSISPNPPQAQTVPWRTQRGQTPQKQQQPVAQTTPAAQSHPQPFYNNVQGQQQQQQQTPRAPDFSTQSSPYQGPKPTNVGSLYIAPLAQPSEPQAQHIVRQQQQLQQQQAPRDSPMRQMANAAGSQPNAQANLRWMSSQPKQAEQPAWVRSEDNGNVVPSSLNRLKSPPPPPIQPPTNYANQQQQQQQAQPMQQQHQPQAMYQPLSMNQGNGFINTTPHNFGAHNIAPTGLRLVINTQSVPNTNNQTGPRERIIPIQLEQTPTYTPPQPSFNTPSAYGAGNVSPAPGYVMRTPNQFVDQGYNNFGSMAQPQRVMSPPMQQSQQQQQLNAPRMVQQQQQQSNVSGGNTRTHIIPIAMDNNEGTRGPISKTPIVIQNDLRTPPVQSKSFRILQKITDTIDDGNNEDSGNSQQQQQRNDNYMDAEPQLQRPTFARQMSAQQARNSPTVEQMRRMKIGQEQGNLIPQTPSQLNQQPRPFYNNNNDYIPPSEQHVPEPKKYTGSAIPSRSFKILQAMTQPENAGEHDNSHDESNDELNDETKSEHNNESSSGASSSSSVEPTSSISMSSLNSDSISSAPTPPPITSPSVSSTPTQPTPIAYPQYPYPYGYPWYPPPPHACPTPQPTATDTPNWPYPYAMPPHPAQNITSPPSSEPGTPTSWPYPYNMPAPPQRPSSPAPENMPPHPYAPYPYFYPYPYAMPPFPPPTSQSGEFAAYLPPPPPYHAYPYPVAPSYSQSSSSSRASSVLPDIVVTPSTDEMPSKIIMQHNIKIEKEKPPKRPTSLDIQSISTIIKPQPKTADTSIVDILTQHLENLESNNLNCSTLGGNKKSYTKNFDQKSPDDNTSPVQITMVQTESEQESDTDSADSDVTTKQYKGKDMPKNAQPLQSIRSVSNIQFYNGHNDLQNNNHEQEDSEDDDDDDSTTADGESDIFDDEEDATTISGDFEYERQGDHPQSDNEDYYVQDNLSVIYEEESDFEKSSDISKGLWKPEKSCISQELDKCIEENDDADEENEADNLVSVSLPLKFSFSKTSSDQPIATVEVGKSLIEDRRNSLTLSEKRNSFSVATLNDSDNEDSDSCDVSVTISLSNSSRSGSVDSKDGLRNMADKYPVEDMPIPESSLQTMASSEEDVSFSFSLNKRNKFVGQTLQGGLTNNIAIIEDKKEEEQLPPLSKTMSKSKMKQSTEELDFFATLMATKVQAQKIKDQTASYWGKSLEQKQEDKETMPEVKEEETPETEEPEKEVEDSNKTSINQTDELKLRTSFWDNFNTGKSSTEPKKSTESEKSTEPKQTTEPKETTENKLENLELKEEISNLKDCTKEILSETEIATEESEEIDDIWANREDDFVPPKKSSHNYWDNSSDVVTQSTDSSETKTQYDSLSDNTKEEEIEDIWASKNTDDYPVKYTTKEEIEDIWASKNTEDYSVNGTTNEAEAQKIMETKDEIETKVEKSNSLEEARNSFWSKFAEINKPVVKADVVEKCTIEKPKRQFTSETMQEKSYSPPILRHHIQELAKCLTPFIHFEWEPTEKLHEEEVAEEPEEEEDNDDTDFWAKMGESNQGPVTKANLSLLPEDQTNSSFWNEQGNEDEDEEEEEPEDVTNKYNHLNYPEEPREVDTDEEIDFWAEIEAKRDSDDENEDLTFHRAATFWVSQDRKNSVDETPYKPVLKKPFPAKLPDEPPTQEHDNWALLEAHKGEEPIIVDPQLEEEKELAHEFDEMAEEPDHNSSTFDLASVHSAVVSSVWQPSHREEVYNTVETQDVEEIDFWSELDKDKNVDVSVENENPTNVNDDLEVKRNNYRKAMAFFTTSIDDPKVETNESETTPTINSQRSSMAEENSAWDWEAVNGAIKATPNEETPKLEDELRKAKKPPKKERKPKSEIKTKSPPQTDIENSKPEELPEVYVEPTLDLKRLSNGGLPDLGVDRFSEEPKVSVRDRVSVFENVSFDASESRRNSMQNQSLSVDSTSLTRPSSLSRNSSTQRSESEIEEDDSGVTDMNKFSETETESDSFPELKKMTSYQRAATHSRLFKLLQEDTEGLEESMDADGNLDELKLRPSRKKVVHNVSITRKQNPNVSGEAETLSQRRERLSLPLRKNTSIDADNPSTPNSPASPIIMNESTANHSVVSDKLVSELVQSLLLKSDSSHLRKLPMEKLQAAAKRVLEEELDSLENTSVESTPSMTPNDSKKDKSYADYYNTWSDANGAGEIVPSKSFRALQDTKRSPWTARCPRVLSSKTINRDLTRVSESPEISMRSSKSQSRENSVGRWRKA